MHAPRLLTVRAIVLFVVLLVAFVLLFPTMRAYLAERQQLQALRAEAVAAAERNEDLEAEIARWRDPAFVAAQARERLAFVLPGETPYRVIDPEVVQTPEPEPTEVPVGPEVPAGATDLPWYAQMWTSVQVAGELPAAETENDATSRDDASTDDTGSDDGGADERTDDTGGRDDG